MSEQADDKERKVKQEKGELFRSVNRDWLVGINLVSCMVVGFSIGYWVLDPFFGTEPWLTIIFFFLGIAAGFKHLIKVALSQKDDDNSDE
jgi:F0F1-type ATP synthase assembly protein I